MRKFMEISVLAIALLAVLASGCSTPRRSAASASAEVRAVLERQVREWNAGNLAGFMETYAKSDRTRFASGGDVSLGWQTVFDRYKKRYGDRAAMGTLVFESVDISMLTPETALAFGRWRLKRAADEPSGLFTLIFRKTSGAWHIVHDHTSAAPSN
jgi:ketosteroid isomerase-like protein